MICFVVALKKECSPLIEIIENKEEFKLADKPCFKGNLFGKDIILAISGIGKVSASLTTQILIDNFHPECIINFGSCGGTNNSVKPLEFYLINKTIQYDFDITEIDNVKVGYIQEYDRAFFPCETKNISFLKQSVLGTADIFTDSKKVIDNLNNMGCSLRDMEGCAISQVCLSNSTPLYMIKGVSDVYGNGSSANQFLENLNKLVIDFPNIIKKLFTFLNN